MLAISKIKLIKIDIEGYEVPVIPAMQALIQKHRPVMQIETDGDNKNIIFSMLNKMDYNMFFVNGNILSHYTDPSDHLPGDLIGIPGEKTSSYKHLFR